MSSKSSINNNWDEKYFIPTMNGIFDDALSEHELDELRSYAEVNSYLEDC